jgi:hypothetical protein
MSKLNPTPDLNCKHGAPLGRVTKDWYLDSNGKQVHLEVLDNAAPFRLVRVRLDSGGYDQGGAYWGLGDPLYYFQGPLSDIEGYVRGRTRDDAKTEVRKLHPKAKFFR